MKKRLLSALLALALVFVLLPTTALAGEVTTNGDISIAGKCWNFTKSTSGYETVYYQVQSNNGVFSTSLDNKTGCVWPTNPYLEITRTGNTITVIVHNKVTITTNKGTNNAAEECIEVNKSNNQTTTLNLVIKGAEGTTNNTLTLECKSYGSALSSYQGGITITGGVTVNAKSTYTNSSTGVSARAINVFNGDLTISGTGTTVNAENKDRNHPTIDVKNAVTISDGATLTAKNTNGGKAISCRSITADGYDFMGRSGNSGSYTTLTGDDKATKLQEYSSIQITPTPTPALEKSNVYVAGTNLYKNTAYTIQNGKPVMGGTYPGNYNIYFDATDYVLHVKDANIDARGTTGIYGTSDIVFVGVNSITASTYGIYSYFKSSDLKISGTGSLNVKTIAGDPAIATAYDTSRSIIISGNGFTVTADTSETTSYAIKSDNDLTITDGAAVIAKSNATRAIDIKGDLTVTNGSLTATSKSDNVPTVQVGGNASFTGSTVTITNHSDRQGKSGEYSYAVSTGLYVGGTLDIKNAAKVTSTVIGGNAIYAKGDITISGDNTEVNAQNSAYKFSAISTNRTVNISDNSTVKAENLKKHQGAPTGVTDPSTGKTYNPCPAITGKIANKNTQNNLNIAGLTTSNAGTKNPTEGTTLNLDIAPSSVEPYIHHYYVTITRGDAYSAPTTYTVTITGENISKYYRSEGELEQTVTAGEAIKTVTVAANDGYYFPDNYVKDLELPSGITATVSGDNWCLTIKGIPSKDATINLPVLSKRPTITVDIPLPVAGNKPATIDQIHLTCDDPNYTPEISRGIRWNKGSLTEESVAIGANDTFVAGTCYNVEIFLSSGIADGAYKLAYAGGGDNPWYAYWGTSNFQLYFQATPAATHTHEKGDLQFNSEGHWYKCAADISCTERIDFASHTYKDNICTVCNYVKPACSHTNLKYIDNNDYETHKVQCADCEEIIAEKEAHDIQGYVIDDAAGTHQAFCNKCHYRGLASHHSIIYVPKDNGHCKACAICKVQLGRVEEHTFENGVCTVCNATSGEIVPPTPDNPGTIVIIRPAEEEKPAQQPNPSTGANDLVGLAVTAAGAAALGSAALLRKHD